MLPLLNVVSDGQPKKFNDVVEILARQFKLTEAERREVLPSGQSLLFGNRVGWARTYLKKAGLLASPVRGTIVLTERGKDVLREAPKAVNVAYLKRFPEFVSFHSATKSDDRPQSAPATDKTPEEVLELTYQNLRESLAQEVLSKVIDQTPAFFERLVVELIVRMGYGGSFKEAGQAIGRSGDEGIDGIIKEDKLGLDVIYLQAKRWQQNATITRPEVQKFVGALAGKRARKGIFITTSTFSKEARSFADGIETKVVLIDGPALAQFMIDYNLGVAPQRTFEVKRLDSDYFELD